MQVEFIFVGRAIYLFWSGAISLRMAIVLGGAALAALAGLYTLTPYSRSVIFVSNSVAYSWAIAIALFCLMVAFVKRCPAPLRFLSDISYSVYMLHIAVGSFVLNVLSLRYGVWIGWSFWIAFAAIVACSYLTYMLIECPFRKLGRQLLRRLQADASFSCFFHST
jgi:peptidoglycan/LPS O-acetylase OafA/YrhL